MLEAIGAYMAQMLLPFFFGYVFGAFEKTEGSLRYLIRFASVLLTIVVSRYTHNILEKSGAPLYQEIVCLGIALFCAGVPIGKRNQT